MTLGASVYTHAATQAKSPLGDIRYVVYAAIEHVTSYSCPSRSLLLPLGKITFEESRQIKIRLSEVGKKIPTRLRAHRLEPIASVQTLT